MQSVAVNGRAAGRGLAALRTELRAMLALALPLALTQIGQVLIHGTEVLLLGRLSPIALASVTLAWALFHVCFIFSMGVVQATAPLIAAAKGARRPREVRRAVRQGLWVALLVTLPLAALLWFGRYPLAWMGQDLALLDGAETYLRSIAFGLPFGAGFLVLRNFVSAYGRTGAIMVVTFLAVVFNLGLSWALIFGELGLPRLEVLGAGIGAASSFAFMFLALLAYCLLARPFRRFAVLGRFWRPDWRTFGEIWRLGLPIGAAMLMETGLFAASTLMMGLIGTAELAAHQVTLQLVATGFMVPLGVSVAATIRVGLAMGARDPAGVRRAGWVATALGAGFMLGMALLYWTAGDRLVALFFDPADPGTPAAVGFAVRFIAVAALFQIVDGLQVIGIANLRGMQDTAIPMWLAGFGYWVVGFPAMASLAFATPLAGTGIWMALAIALALVAVMMLWRFWRLTAPDRLDRRLGGATSPVPA